MKPHVLFVEDDPVIREATQLALEREGFSVTTAADGRQGLEEFQAATPDVALLDVMLPEVNGISLCRRIREESLIPVVMLSARDDAVDVVIGLEAGADDYVTKPFDVSILAARLRAVLRRSGTTGHADPAPDAATRGHIRVGDGIEIDPEAITATKHGEPLQLTPTEMRLLLYFAESPGVVLSRDTLLKHVWDYAWGGDSRVVDVHVQRLRAKIGPGSIETVRGFGYKLVSA